MNDITVLKELSALGLYLMMYLLLLERLFVKKERVYEFDVTILEDGGESYIALVPASSGGHTQDL